MKIGIVTITSGENYGNRLQNYALQYQLIKRGYEVETFYNLGDNNINNITNIKIRIKSTLKEIIFYKKYRNEILRKKSFKDFNKKFMFFSKYKLSNNEVPKEVSKIYDLFICGSDQIWNPNYKENSRINFLDFVDLDKRNSFSASFGAASVPKERITEYSKWLNSFKNISVREDAGKDIVTKLTGRKDVEVLVDPTMLLDSSEWDSLTRKPIKLNNKKFILNYFLGELSDSRRGEIERIAKENNCIIIDILDKKGDFYSCGPNEFLFLEKNAFLVCTDSFHSCVFAILFNTPFIVFDREEKIVSMNSRIDTLLNKFKLKDRKFIGRIDSKQLICNYDEAYKILKIERKKANLYLDKILINN